IAVTGKSQSTASVCGTYATRCRARAIGSPKMLTLPMSVRIKPRIALSSVLLPAPLGPMIPTDCPGATSSDTARNTDLPSYDTETLRTASAAGGVDRVGASTFFMGRLGAGLGAWGLGLGF